jgi:hypothetical protein
MPNMAESVKGFWKKIWQKVKRFNVSDRPEVQPADGWDDERIEAWERALGEDDILLPIYLNRMLCAPHKAFYLTFLPLIRPQGLH